MLVVDSFQWLLDRFEGRFAELYPRTPQSPLKKKMIYKMRQEERETRRVAEIMFRGVEPLENVNLDDSTCIESVSVVERTDLMHVESSRGSHFKEGLRFSAVSLAAR